MTQSKGGASSLRVASRGAPIVVGVDDSPGTSAAIDWACEEARNRKVAVTVVHGYTWAASQPSLIASDEEVLRSLRNDSRRLVEQVCRRVRNDDPTLRVTSEIAQRRPAELMAEHSAHGSLVVVGHNRRTVVGRLVLGSVGTAVVARAPGPVVVACGGTPVGREPVVAAVRFDETAEPVLAFAFDHASRHGLGVRAVACTPRIDLTEFPGPEPSERWLLEALAGWKEQYPDVPVEPLVLDTPPTGVLLRQSSDASLLVLGRRGRHTMLGGMLGSVSEAVLRHASRPVAIVPVEPESTVPDEHSVVGR